jgi:ABC-type transport system involved in multi-copper enzyme maturation permease subunit
MIGAIRSELTRLRRRSYVLGWLGITALFGVMINAFVFSSADAGTTAPENGPGGGFPTLAELVQPDGIVAPLGAAATFLGVITLAFWAIAAATDYSTGLIRILVQAEPRRIRLLAGKVVALIGWTAAATTVATIVTVCAAPVMAKVFGVSTDAWGSDLLSITAGAWLDTFLALVVWGVIGLVIAVLTRSSAIAITIGIGYVLVVESIVGLVADDLAHWLPGQTLTALAQGGTADVAYGTAVVLGLLYATIGLVSAAVTFAKRDVLD